MLQLSDISAARLKRRSSGQQVAAYLRGEIFAGRLAPGQRINQEETAALLGVSRLPVRDALAILENEGRISIEFHRGAFVLPMDAESIRDNTEIFGVIYAFVARRAAERLSKGLDAELAAIATRLAVAESGEEVWLLVERYLDAIMEVGVSKRMNQTLRRMRILAVSDIYELAPGVIEATRDGTVETISLIRAGDGDGAADRQMQTQRAAAELLVRVMEARDK